MAFLSYDYLKRIKKPIVVLCNPDKTVYGNINVHDLKYTRKLVVYDEISFEMNKFEDNKLNNYYDKVSTKRKIFLKDIGYFILQEPAEEINSEKITKTCTAYSAEKELEYKFLKKFYINCNLTSGGITDVTLYDKNDASKSLMNIIVNKLYGWKIGIMPERITKKAVFEIDSQDIYSFLTKDVAKAYKVIFIFDSLHYTINAYTVADFNKEMTNIVISEQNLLNTANITYNEDSLVNTINVAGKDDLYINPVNFGLNKIVNYDYFIYENSDWYDNKYLYHMYKTWQKILEKPENFDEQNYVDNFDPDKVNLETATYYEKLIAYWGYYYREYDKLQKYLYDVPNSTTYNDWVNYTKKDESDKEILDSDRIRQELLKYGSIELGIVQKSFNAVKESYEKAKWDTKPEIIKTYDTDGIDIEYTEVGNPNDKDKKATTHGMYYLDSETGDVWSYVKDWGDKIPSELKVGTVTYPLISDYYRNPTDSDIKDKDCLWINKNTSAIYLFLVSAKKWMYYQAATNKFIYELEISPNTYWKFVKKLNVKSEKVISGSANQYELYTRYIQILELVQTRLTTLNNSISLQEQKVKNYVDIINTLNESIKTLPNYSKTYFKENYPEMTDSEIDIEVDKITAIIEQFTIESDYSDDSYGITTSMTNGQKIKKMAQLKESAQKELSKIIIPQMTLSVTSSNLFALSDFVNWREDFEIGNFINVRLKNGLRDYFRLSEISINFEDMSDFSFEFVNKPNSLTPGDDLMKLIDDSINTSANAISKAAYTAVKSDLENGTIEISEEILNKISEISSMISSPGTLSVDEIYANKGVFKEIISEYIEANKIKANEVDTEFLRTLVADIDSAFINQLQSTLVNSQIITSQIAAADNSVLNYALMGKLEADSVLSGKIDTTKLTIGNGDISSNKGIFKIADNTLLVTDGNGTPRVELGHLSNDDTDLENYSIAIWDKDKQLLFDPLGLTEKGTWDGLARTDLLKNDEDDGYSISDGYLSKSALVKVINNSKNTTTISSSNLDYNGTSLSAYFNEICKGNKTLLERGSQIRETIDGFDSKVWSAEFNGTSISTKFSNITQNIDKVQLGVQESYKSKAWDTNETFTIYGTTSPDKANLDMSKYTSSEKCTYLDTITGYIYTYNFTSKAWRETGHLELLSDSLSSQFNSSLTITKNSILTTVSTAEKKYDTSEYNEKTIYYGYGIPTSVIEAAVGEYYLDQNNGNLYIQKASGWSKIATLELITSVLKSDIETLAGKTILRVSDNNKLASIRLDATGKESIITLASDSIDLTACNDITLKSGKNLALNGGKISLAGGSVELNSNADLILNGGNINLNSKGGLSLSGGDINLLSTDSKLTLSATGIRYEGTASTIFFENGSGYGITVGTTGVGITGNKLNFNSNSSPSIEYFGDTEFSINYGNSTNATMKFNASEGSIANKNNEKVVWTSDEGTTTDVTLSKISIIGNNVRFYGTDKYTGKNCFVVLSGEKSFVV